MSGKKTAQLVFGALLAVTLVVTALPVHEAAAAQLTNRSLLLQDGTTDGASKPGGVVNHFFTFTTATTANIGSIQFQYCTVAVYGTTCTLPTGVVTTSATLGSQSGTTFTSVNNATNGAPYLTRASASSINSGTQLSFQLQTVTNPSTANYTFFVRIATYNSTNATGTPVDTGTVAASTATQIVLTGIMPESLIFCTGGTVNTTSGVPDCSTASGGNISFDRLFSPTDTAVATSQMAASTNAGGGYSITVNGTTLTSGSNTIPAMTTTAAGVRGTSQFGLNLKANTTTTSTPAVGNEVAPASNGVDLRGQAATGYSTVDQFKFHSTDSVANSANGGAGPTNSQIFTVSYIVNVAGAQLAGTYTTTLTYICTPTF